MALAMLLFRNYSVRMTTFSLLSSHFTTPHQLRIFCCVHEEGERRFLKWHTCLINIHTLMKK